MEFAFVGFSQLDNMQYQFDAVGKNGTRQQVTVSEDLNLIRRYGIPLQELPLRCCRLLAGQAEIESIAFSESDMTRYATECAVEPKELMEKR